MSSPLPKSPEHSDKSKKYDRQIRLWGLHGQNTLETAKVCLVNATCVGCEALKSVILPGIGGFTIVDTQNVSETDLGTNFFIEMNKLGQSRAFACMKVLQELNPDVSGDAVNESAEYILTNRPEFFNNFDFVIATNLNETSLLKLARALWEANVPFLYCRSLGMFGSIRLQLKEHCVIESHADNMPNDLRLEQPFPALQKYLEGSNITKKSPWPVIIYKFLQQWRAEHEGRIPSSYKEKTEFRDAIREANVTVDENYEEAAKAVNTVFGNGNPSSRLKAIFDNEACVHLTTQSKPFWIMAHALKEFVQYENNNLLPVTGILHDMTADTESYINLQNIYRHQAAIDADNIYRKCQTYLKELGLPPDTITESLIRIFCREAAGLTVIHGTEIAKEFEKANPALFNVEEENELPGTLTEFYVVMRAYERFLLEFGSVPGEVSVENDLARLKTTANKMLADWGSPTTNANDDVLHEVCRYGGAELHSVSSFIGGCAAQEAIKIITKQYRPIDNTFLFDGITTKSEVLKL